jgi:3-dehydroquinate dehydratase/shikimate dehydrogenase
MLCTSIKHEDKQAIEQANREADLIEFCLDLFKPKDLRALRQLCKKPVIFRLKRLDFQALSERPDYVDLPHTLSSETFETVGTQFPFIKRICSYHDFEKTENLYEIYSKLKTYPSEIYKIATRVHSTLDGLHLLQLARRTGCLAIGMGEMGAFTRILAPIFNVPWTYAPLSFEHKTAPGQILLSTLKNLYRYEKLSPSTSIFGLIGDPVEQSPGHQFHNAVFETGGRDAVYVKMAVKKEELSPCLHLFQSLGFKGLSITMPLKKAVKKHLKLTHYPAINTLKFEQNEIVGWNTDGEATADLLGSVEGKNVVILGAGGSAWGVAKEIVKRGGHCQILNRTFSLAQELANEIGGEAFELTDFHKVAKEGYDILINCTSVGMEPNRTLPVAGGDLLKNKCVADLAMHQELTPLLQEAKLKDCKIISGMEIYIQQALKQQKLWFDLD